MKQFRQAKFILFIHSIKIVNKKYDHNVLMSD